MKSRMSSLVFCACGIAANLIFYPLSSDAASMAGSQGVTVECGESEVLTVGSGFGVTGEYCANLGANPTPAELENLTFQALGDAIAKYIAELKKVAETAGIECNFEDCQEKYTECLPAFDVEQMFEAGTVQVSFSEPAPLGGGKWIGQVDVWVSSQTQVDLMCTSCTVPF